MKNILFISETPHFVGGGEVSLLLLITYLNRENFTPMIIIPGEGSFTDQVRATGTTIFNVELKKIKNPFHLIHNINLIRQIRHIINDHHIHLIHSSSSSGISLLGAIAAKQEKIPFFWHVRSMARGWGTDVLLGCLSQKIILISHAIKRRFLLPLFLKKYQVVYNAVEESIFENYHESQNFRSLINPENKILIGTVGRYHPLKGYQYLIETARIVIQNNPNVTFVVVGLNYSKDNEYIELLEDLLKRENLTDHVLLLGPEKNISKVLSALDVFVHFTTQEGEAFGRVLIEAMAVEKPIVSFDKGAEPEIIDDGVTGFLVKQYDFIQFANKLLTLINDESLRRDFGRKGKERVRNLFLVDQQIKTIEDLYQRYA